MAKTTKRYELPARIFVDGKEVVPSTDYEFAVEAPKEKVKCQRVNAISET